MVRIEELQARIADEAALAKLLASMPLPQSVRPLLQRHFFGRKWDPARRRDHWFASDGANVVCLQISGASASIAMRMRLRFDDLRSACPGLQPSRKIVHGLLEAIVREDGQVATISVEARTRPRATRS